MKKPLMLANIVINVISVANVLFAIPVTNTMLITVTIAIFAKMGNVAANV